MFPLWMAFGVALAGAIALTPLARLFARRLDIVDQPDGRRKLQKRPVPLFGGVAVYLSLVLGLWAANYLAAESFPGLTDLTQVVVAASGFVCLFGCIDDTWDLSPRFKLLLQACSVLPIVMEGYTIERLHAFGQPFELGWLGVPITVLWLLACINALNLLDGMDGMASLVGLSTAAMLAIIALNLGHGHVSLIAIALAGALAGFLLYNLPPASIYLGDSGSMVIGMVVGILGIQAALKTPATLSITAPAVLMSIPMLDTMLAIVRRKLSGQRIDAADRGHIHHRLLERGLTNWQALGVIGLLCLLTGAAASAAIFLRSDGLAWAIALSLVVLLVRLRVFGHHELALVKLTVATALVRMVQRLVGSLRVRPSDASGQGAMAFDAAWPALVTEIRAWSTVSVELTSGHEQGDRRHAWQFSGWCRGVEERPSGALEWSFTVSFRASDERFCELRLIGQGLQACEPWQQTRMAQLLTTFCQHWSEHADSVPASQNWSDAEDGSLVGQPATLALHPIPKAA